MAEQKKTVAIIGAGVTGITAAKNAFEEGLIPTVFNKTAHIGGIWSPTGLTWEGMNTNVPYHCVSLSGFHWPRGGILFPKSRQVYQYLLNYIDAYKIGDFFRLNTWVESIRQLDDKRWQVTSISNGQKSIEVFDFCIITSGFNSQPCLPPEYEAGKATFKGEILHSADYRTNDSRFKDKRIIIVGAAASGSEISIDLVSWAKSVTMLVRNKYFIVPKIIREKKADGEYKLDTIDSALFIRQRHYTKLDDSTKLEATKQYFKKLCPIQTDKSLSHPSIYIDVDKLDLSNVPKVCISEELVELVQNSIVQVKHDVVDSFKPDGILTKDGTFLEADVILCCTSHRANFSFFNEETVKVLNFDAKCSNNPIILYKNTWHPDLPNLGFIGIFRSIVTLVGELQSKWILQVFKNELALPSREVMLEAMSKEREKREKNPQIQYPYTFNYLCDMVATEIGAMPDLDKIKAEDPELYEMLWTGPVLPEHFQLHLPEKRESAIEYIKYINSLNNRTFSKADAESMKLNNFA